MNRVLTTHATKRQICFCGDGRFDPFCHDAMESRATFTCCWYQLGPGKLHPWGTERTVASCGGWQQVSGVWIVLWSYSTGFNELETISVVFTATVIRSGGLPLFSTTWMDPIHTVRRKRKKKVKQTPCYPALSKTGLSVIQQIPSLRR
jgi:hypothetical protein